MKIICLKWYDRRKSRSFAKPEWKCKKEEKTIKSNTYTPTKMVYISRENIVAIKNITSLDTVLTLEID